jgi:cytochrome c biogenesis protein CcmG/thiol:disulfide interchange protein DsbE
VLVASSLRQAPVSSGIAVGAVAPPVAGTTLDGTTFDLASLRGRPVIVNFWGPSCIPCRDEFPLFEQELAAHAADGLAIVGVLTDDPPDPARAFVADYHATWPTVIDPNGALKATYKVAARPQSYFIDATGVLRGLQVGQMTTVDFDRLYPSISGASPGASAAPAGTEAP